MAGLAAVVVRAALAVVPPLEFTVMVAMVVPEAPQAAVAQAATVPMALSLFPMARRASRAVCLIPPARADAVAQQVELGPWVARPARRALKPMAVRVERVAMAVISEPEPVQPV